MLANVPEPPGGANDRRSGAPISAGSARSRLLAAVFVRRFEAQVGAGAGEGGARAVIAPCGIPGRRVVGRSDGERRQGEVRKCRSRPGIHSVTAVARRTPDACQWPPTQASGAPYLSRIGEAGLLRARPVCPRVNVSQPPHAPHAAAPPDSVSARSREQIRLDSRKREWQKTICPLGKTKCLKTRSEFWLPGSFWARSSELPSASSLTMR